MDRIKTTFGLVFGRLFQLPDKYKKFDNSSREKVTNSDSEGSSISMISSNRECAGEFSQPDSSDSDDRTTHCHTELSTRMPEVDKRARRKLVIASVLCLLFTIGEAIGGILAGSLAVATDSAHMLTDFASFMISLLAIYLASRPPTTKLSFGWHRAEIMGALVSVQLIWIVTGVLVYMAVQRVIHREYTIKPIPMIITASCAVLINIILGATLHGVGGHGHSHGGGGHGHSHSGEHSHSESGGADTNRLIDPDLEKNSANNYGATNSHREDSGHSHTKRENLNVRAAFIHVVGDLIQSIGVLVAAIIIYFKPEWKLADPICTFLFSVLVLFSTINILKDAVRVLMEATPQNLEFKEVKDTLMSIDGVVYVHNLRIWSITTTKVTMSVHLAIDDVGKFREVLQEASLLVLKRYDLKDVTIQIEPYSSEMDDCDHCQDPITH